VGYVVHTMREVYSEKTAQRLADERWLKKCSREDWVVFSKDKKLRIHTSREYRAVHRYKNRCFVLPRGKLREAEQIKRFVDNRFRIALRSRKPGPYIIPVHENGLGKDYIARESQ
jgi:hypothetical protein